MKKILNFSKFLTESNYTEVKPNKYVYHTSNPMFRNQIAKQGLIPKGKSETWLSDTKIDGKVIFAINSDDKEEWWDSGYDDDIYKIDTSKLKNKWYFDPNYQSGVYKQDNITAVITFKKIPTKAIKLIHKGSGESFE